LLGMGLELLHKQRRRHPAQLHRTRRTEHLVPPVKNPGPIDPTGHMGLEPRRARLCRKFCSGGREGVVAPVGGEIRRPGSRTVRPQ
jgi:hypothetical protein